MYIPPATLETRPDVVFDFIEAHPLAALVTSSGSGLFATHLPLVLDRSAQVLRGHVARANPHHRDRSSNGDALVIFSDPGAYITPSWYPTKQETAKVVPTWNYIAVHVYGPVSFIDDAAWLATHLRSLTDRNEAGRDKPWSIDDAPGDYLAQQMKAIVGVEIPIARVEAKWKMSQNRSTKDIDGVIEGLAANEDTRRIAEIVRERRPSKTT